MAWLIRQSGFAGLGWSIALLFFLAARGACTTTASRASMPASFIFRPHLKSAAFS
jgi:hypothetical protein